MRFSWSGEGRCSPFPRRLGRRFPRRRLALRTRPRHDGLSPSLKVLAFETFGDDGGFREEMDTTVRHHRVLVAVAQPSGDAFEVLHGTDPTAPTVVAAWYGDSAADYLDGFKFFPGGEEIAIVGTPLRILDVRDLDR